MVGTQNGLKSIEYNYIITTNKKKNLNENKKNEKITQI